MTERLYNISKDQNETSNGLLNDIRKRSSLNRMYEKQSLALKKKLVEERKKAYDAASRKEGEGKGGLGFLRDLFLLKFLRGRGGGGFGRGGGARPPVGPTGGGLGITPRITPKNNIVPFNKPRIGAPRVGALAILGTGIDFTSRLGGGQNILQAGLGAGGGLAGALAGAKYGAIAGSFAGPVGTLIGGVGGSVIGGLAGGSIADLLSGADRRRGEELERVTLMSRKTEFSKASDDFDVVLDKFEGDTAPMLKSMKSGTEEAPSTGVGLPTPPDKPKFWTAGRIFDTVLFAGELLLFAAAVLSPFEGVAGDIGAGALLTRRLAKIFGKNAIKNFSRKGFSVPRSVMLRRGISSTPGVTVGSGKVIKNISNKSITERISRAVEGGNFPKQSRVGIIKRQGANELLMTRIDNILAGIRRKSVLFPERITGFNNQGVLRQFTRGPLRTNVVKPRQDRYSYLKNLFKGIKESGSLDPKVVNQNFADYIKKVNINPQVLRKSLKNNPNLSVLEAIQKQLRREGSKFQKTKRFGSVDPTGTAKNMNVPPEVFKQEGGRVEAGKPYIVGEIGKELFVPDASGEIIPNEDLPSSNLLVINREPETVIVPQIIDTSSDTPIASNTVNPYDVVAKYAQMTGLFTV